MQGGVPKSTGRLADWPISKALLAQWQGVAGEQRRLQGPTCCSRTSRIGRVRGRGWALYDFRCLPAIGGCPFLAGAGSEMAILEGGFPA